MLQAVKEISDEKYIAQREKYQLVERLPVPQPMTEEERYQWLAEYCDSMKYFKPTAAKAGHYVLIDCDGQKTIENNFGDAVEMAAAKFKEQNG